MAIGASSVPIWVSGIPPRRHPIPGARHASGLFPLVRAPGQAGEGQFVLPDPEWIGEARSQFVTDGGEESAELVLWLPRPPEDVDLVAAEAAGATWYLEGDERRGPEELIARIAPGPPD